MMKTTTAPLAQQTWRLIAGAALAPAFAFAFALTFANAARAADTPVSPVPSVPKSAPKAAAKQNASSAGASLADRLQAVCSSADLNHDGKVSLDEFHHDIVRSWHNLAPNAAGFVPLADLAQVPRIDKARLRRLAVADNDNDGQLSFKEVVQARMAYFDAADADQNDQLSLEECIAFERQRRSSTP